MRALSFAIIDRHKLWGSIVFQEIRKNQCLTKHALDETVDVVALRFVLPDWRFGLQIQHAIKIAGNNKGRGASRRTSPLTSILCFFVFVPDFAQHRSHFLYGYAGLQSFDYVNRNDGEYKKRE